jgi:hypothetical protein
MSCRLRVPCEPLGRSRKPTVEAVREHFWPGRHVEPALGDDGLMPGPILKHF